MGQFAVIDVDRADEQPHGLCILHGQVTESANSRDSDPFSRLRRSLLDPLVGRDSSADQRRGIRRRNTGRNVGNIIRIGEYKFSKTTLLGIAAELCLSTPRLPASQAELTVPTR